MKPNEQNPTIRHVPPPMGGTVESHPAFGQISASRVSGQSTLYGSDFLHHNFVEIRVTRSELHRSLSRDWHFGKDEIVSLCLSEAQWATFVSSMNRGSGIPCTLQYVAGERQPYIPFRTQTDHFKTEADAAIQKLTARVDAAITQMEGEIGSSLSAKKKDQLLSTLRMLRQDVASNLPFVANSLAEHMENTVETAKTEVHAYIASAIERAGIAALSATTPLQLSSGDNDADS